MLFYPGAQAQNLVGEVGVLDDGSESEPILGAEVLLLEETFFPGGEEVLTPGLIKLLGKFVVEALEVPVIVAEFGGVHGLAKIGEDSPLGEKSLNLIIFVDDTVDFAGVIDGRISIVDTIVDEGVGQEDGFRGECPDFEAEAEVLIRGARSGEKSDFVLDEEFAAVDGRPDSWGELENITVIFWRDDELFWNLGDAIIQCELSLRVGAAAIIITLDDVGVALDGSLVHDAKSVRLDPIVGLEDADIFPLGVLEAEVHRIAIAGVFLINNRDTRIFLRKALHDGERAVGRAVIDTDNF